MRNVFEHLGRTIGLSALGPCGLTIAEDVIAPNARRADLRHEPNPARADQRARLGLLGRIASILCLIELYSGAPLPDDAHERTVAEEILVDLRDVLGKKPSATPEEEEFVVSMHTTFSQARKEARDEGRIEGRNEGRAEARASDVITVLRARTISVPDAARERILAQKDPVRLERWLEKAATATTLAEVLDDPS